MAPVDLSVIIPARDEAALIDRCLDSVRRQDVDLGRLEAIVIANGCTDDTAAVAHAWAEAHPQLSVHVLESQRAGVAAAKNAGVAAASGRLVLFLDADSRMRRDLAGRILENEAAGFPAGTVRVAADSRDALDRAFFDMIELGKKLGAMGMMFYGARDDFLALGGFDARLRHAEDLVLQQRIATAGIPFRHVGASAILTSPRRLRTLPFRLGMFTMLVRWTLASIGIGRRWHY